MLKKVLIANRGEIAVRIQRACRALDIVPVAVYSDADRHALHVRMADEAIRLGPAPSTQSYLVQEKLLEAAAETGADAIHPGYGFLSENAGFARAVQKAGLTWVGPSPEAMDAMGDKVAARANAEAVGVPTAPGSEALRDASHAHEEAERIGYPVMLKASAGGGGIGMRVVRRKEDLSGSFEEASKQAASAFGVPDVFMEKFIEHPRHLEVQILADQHGHAIHLYERECSIQRRHQKLVEEAPSPVLDDEAREAIGAKAVALAKHVDYSNAGTLEFLYEDGEFYFNEMNTRIQVEHPVTELITGVDLVQWQLRIAAGETLDLQQSDIKIQGHAFEARITAEDPYNDFRPNPGKVHRLHAPAGAGIRIDSGIYEGWQVPSVYDSMVMKLLSHGADRHEALDRMQHALVDLDIQGFICNKAFHERLFANRRFQAGDMTTRFLEEEDLMQTRTDPEVVRAAVALVMALKDRPGGGLAGAHLAQSLPARKSGGVRRDWRRA